MTTTKSALCTIFYAVLFFAASVQYSFAVGQAGGAACGPVGAQTKTMQQLQQLHLQLPMPMPHRM